jgi:hypothetical protein
MATQANAVENRITDKSVGLGIGLNLLWPGIGYCYFGKYAIGIMCMIIIPILAIPTAGFFWLAYLVFMCIDMCNMGKKSQKDNLEAISMKCPECAEMVKKEATKCRFCGHQF